MCIRDRSTTSAAITINVKNLNAPPQALFTAACSGLSCAFDASGSLDPDGTIVGYAWLFGDGGSGSGSTTSHTYSGSGSYTVTLTVTDNQGATAQSSKTVDVAALAATMHIGDLDGSYARFWFWTSATVSAIVRTGSERRQSPTARAHQARTSSHAGMRLSCRRGSRPRAPW